MKRELKWKNIRVNKEWRKGEIRREEVMNPLKKMKRFKVAGLNDIERVC